MGAGPVVPGPFPDIADHVGQAMPIGGKGSHRRRALEAVTAPGVLWISPRPVVGHDPSARAAFVPPGIDRAVQPAPGGGLELRLGRQVLAGPPGEGQGVGMGDLDHGMIEASAPDRGLALRLSPVGARDIAPSVGPVDAARRALAEAEDQSAGPQPGGIDAGIERRVRRLLRHGHMAGGLDEGGEGAVGDRRAVDAEGGDVAPAHRRLLGVMAVGAHAEPPAGDLDHVLGDGAHLSPACVRGRGSTA